MVKDVHEEMNAILEMRLNHDSGSAEHNMLLSSVMAPFARLLQSICALMSLRGAPRPTVVVT